MPNPVLVEAVRAAHVESRHRGAMAVVDADGAAVLAVGDVERLVYPRSAVKALQALVLVESGAPERYALTDAQLALACASHGGEPGHVDAALGMLAAAGLDAGSLECGAHWPMHAPSAQALARSGATASAVHNNCSGKHAGFLCAACALGVEPRGYVMPGHPVQREVKARLESLAGLAITDDQCASDNCSVPTWALPLSRLALAFARFGTGQGVPPVRAAAATRLRLACAAHTWHVAGTGRFCTAVMEHFGERVFVKTGAEGVFCGALPELGYGIAIKCDDGAGRAAEVVMAAVIARLLPLGAGDRALSDRLLRPTLRSWNGVKLGELRPGEALRCP
jgi:L-asparaginase II